MVKELCLYDLLDRSATRTYLLEKAALIYRRFFFALLEQSICLN